MLKEAQEIRLEVEAPNKTVTHRVFGSDGVEQFSDVTRMRHGPAAGRDCSKAA